MPESRRKIREDFEQLPDAEAPFGQHTRIKALAREQLQASKGASKFTRRWVGGLTTFASAALVYFIASPLLQKPSSFEPANVLSDAIVEEQLATHDIAPTIETESSVSLMRQNFSAGSSGSKSRAINPVKPPQVAMKSAVTQPATSSAESTSELAAAPAKNIKQSIRSKSKTPLKVLLSRLKQAEAQNDVDEAKDIRAEIKQLYPDYKKKERK